MISAEEQKKVADLVKQTKDLILKEMDEEEVMIKGAANYVTNVDLAVQNFLKEELGKVFPEISLIAEEKENLGLSKEETYWILDPIDGTTNLIRDFHMSAVALGLYEKGEIVFGIVTILLLMKCSRRQKGKVLILMAERSRYRILRILVMRLFPMVPLLIKKRKPEICFPFFTAFL